MKRCTFLLMIIFLFSFSSFVEAHSGRTDSSGGHNCSDKSIAKGLCSGYHYHNGGSSSKPAQSPAVAKPVYNPKVYYDRGYKEGYADGRVKGYQKGQVNTEAPETNTDYIEGWSAGFQKGYEEGKQKILQEEKDQKDRKQGVANGTIDGKKAFLEGQAKDAYAYSKQNSDVYKSAYIETFAVAWKEARLEKSCFEEGHAQGLEQDEVEVAALCEESNLKTAFQEGHEKGVNERDELQIGLLLDQGMVLGYSANKLEIPENLQKESYVAAFEKGYYEGVEKRKVEIKSEGYDVAFKLLTFTDDIYMDNELLHSWYQEGYEENLLAQEIKDTAQLTGQESKDYIIDEKYKVTPDAIRLYDSLFAEGQLIKTQREQEQRNLMLSLAGIAAPAAGGVYYWRRKRKDAA